MMTTAVRALRLLTITVLLVAALAAVPPPADAQLNVTGQWSTLPYQMPLNPIHVAVLKNGKVLVVAGSENNPYSTIFKAAVWNPVTGTFSQQVTPWDLFCNGMSFLPDGRVIMTGGNLEQLEPGPGPPWTTIFDPVTEKFYRMEDMAKGRWYPSNTPLNDGGTMVFGGLDEQTNTNNTVEMYDVGAGWSPPYPANFSPGWYPRLHLLGNGKVFMGAPNPMSHTFDPAAGTWSATGSMTNYADDRLYGSSVMLPLDPNDGYAPKVVLFGGNVNGATNTVEMIDLGNWPETWVTMPPMSVPRVNMNAVLLPNGKILTMGGSTAYNDPGSAHLNAQTFDPVAKTWTSSGTMAKARLYHSTALLLPDATVYVGGSNPGREVWDPSIEIYKPPYLFTSSGAAAARPTIGTTPAVIGYGQTFSVATPQTSSVSKVMLIRPGSNTHAFDQEQRLVYMFFTKNLATNTLSVTAPTSMGAAPPGYYMLFILNSAGVPSVAKFVQLLQNPTNQAPTATIANPAGNVTINAGQSVTFAGTASDPDGSITKYAWVFPGGSPSKSSAPNPGAVTFATPGVYTVSLTVLDNGTPARNNPSPPTVTVTVNGTAALGAAITSPANGATVSGTVTVNMAATNAQGSPTQFVLKLDNGATLSTQSIAGSSPTATYAWNTTTTTNAAHTLNLTVTDGAGRTATSAISVTVANGTGGTGPQNVVWTSPVNVTVSGNTITKNGGCNGCWDAGAASVQTIASGSGSVTFKISTGTGATVGLSNGNAGTGANDIKFGLRFTPGSPGFVEVRESGVYKADWANVASATHKVAVEGGVVKYYQNGSLKYTSALAPTYPLLVDATIDNIGNAVQTAIITTGTSGGGDTTAPTVALTAPAGGATVSGTSVTVSATASDNVGVASVQFKLDGANLGTADTTAPYSITWNTTTATNGTHTLTATATDAAGNATTSAPVTVTVSNGGGGDTTPPTVTLTAPAGGATVSGTAVAVSATASDNVGVASVQFKLDGANLGAADTTAPYAITWNTTTATNGTHTLTATATDAAGNSTTSAPVMVTVSNSGGGTGPQNVVWTALVKAAASGNTITKTSGCDGCFDAGGVSQQTIASGNGSVEFTVSAGAYITAGLSVGNGGPAAEEIDFGLRFYPGSPGIVEVRENGAYKSDWANVAGAVHKVAVEGGAVKYYLNGTLKYTSAILPTYPLLVDASLGSAGSAVQAAVITTGTSSGGGDTTPPTVTLTAPAGGATVSGTTVTVSASASDNVGVATVQFKLDGANLGTADTTAPYSITWNTTTATNGTHTLTATATDAAGNTTTSAPVTVTVSNSGGGSGPQNVVWTSLVNALASGNTITKSAGCDGCFDAGGVSQQTIVSGNGSVEFTLPAGVYVTVGLSVGNTGPAAEEIDFGLRFYPGSPGIVEVRENGTYKWDWLNVTGAVHKIAVDGGAVKYYLNGTLKYTSAILPTYPLLLDASLGSAGSAVQNAVITIGP